MMNVERVSAAQRRRGRRLRAALRHERQSIAMALAEMSHHSAPRGPRMAGAGEEGQSIAMALAEMSHHSAPRGPRMARAGEEGHRNEYEAPRRQKPPPPQAFFRLFDEEDAERGLRPACLAEPRGPQERVQLHTVEHIADVLPMVQILDGWANWGWTSWWSRSGTSTCSFPSRLSKCPRSRLLAVVAGAGVSLCSKWRNSWWKCRNSCRLLTRSIGRSLTFLFRRLAVFLLEVFKVSSQDRTTSCSSSRPLTFQFRRVVGGGGWRSSKFSPSAEFNSVLWS